MARLALLIRLSRRDLDERRAELARSEQAVAQAERHLSSHDGQVMQEAALARESIDGMAAFGPWARRAAGQRHGLVNRIAEAQALEAAAREAMREAFAALKRLELADEAARRTAKRDAARRDERRAEEQVTLKPKPEDQL